MPSTDVKDHDHDHPDRDGQKRILRDHLAYDRTIMANERSLLAYARTGLTSVVTGLAFLKFMAHEWAQAAGWMLIVVGPVFIVFGAYRFVQLRERYRHEMDHLPE